jgi:hypothetical protein
MTRGVPDVMVKVIAQAGAKRCYGVPGDTSIISPTAYVSETVTLHHNGFPFGDVGMRGNTDRFSPTRPDGQIVAEASVVSSKRFGRDDRPESEKRKAAFEKPRV